jgi:deoxyribodipyrimidine photo-lyase
LADTRSRLDSALDSETEIAQGSHAIDHVLDWTRQNGFRQLVTPYIPIGPTADLVRMLSNKLGSHGIGLIPILRCWDKASWPYATHGFFKFREKIPKILRQVSLPSAN